MYVPSRLLSDHLLTFYVHFILSKPVSPSLFSFPTFHVLCCSATRARPPVHDIFPRTPTRDAKMGKMFREVLLHHDR